MVGCVDGTQIKIKAPNVNEGEYVNRKGFHSLNVQVIFFPTKWTIKIKAYADPEKTFRGGGAGSIPTLWFCACVHLLLNFLDIWTFIAKLAAFKIIAATL